MNPALCVLLVSALLSGAPAAAQEHADVFAPWAEGAPRAGVLLLGTFHFRDAGLDEYKPRFHVDVRSPERQREVEEVVGMVAERFRPTRVAVEVRPERQPWLDSLYAEYRAGRYALGANEVFQLGFRLAARLGHERVYGVDALARRYVPDMTQAEYEGVVARRPPVDTTWDARYAALYAHDDSLKTVTTLREFFLYQNSPERLRLGHGAYLVGGFGMSGGPGDFFGVDQMTGWWNRNLRVFQSIRGLAASPELDLVEVSECLE